MRENRSGISNKNANSLATTHLSRRKMVDFKHSIKVILIPCRNEYKSAGLYSILWWNTTDYFSFQQSAHSEIRLLSSYENIG